MFAAPSGTYADRGACSYCRTKCRSRRQREDRMGQCRDIPQKIPLAATNEGELSERAFATAHSSSACQLPQRERLSRRYFADSPNCLAAQLPLIGRRLKTSAFNSVLLPVISGLRLLAAMLCHAAWPSTVVPIRPETAGHRSGIRIGRGLATWARCASICTRDRRFASGRVSSRSCLLSLLQVSLGNLALARWTPFEIEGISGAMSQ